MSLRVCLEPGCPVLTDRRRCAEHRSERDRARGTRQERGYDRVHDKLRRHWAPLVAKGTVLCARCHLPIEPSEPWDLGHDDMRRHHGPEHAAGCNRAAAGRAAHA